MPNVSSEPTNHSAPSVRYPLFLTCPVGWEQLLADEMTGLAPGSPPEPAHGGVAVTTDLEGIYCLCLGTRLASRVLLGLAESAVDSPQDLYSLAESVEWQVLFSASSSFRVDFSGTGAGIRNTQFGALKVKDAIVDKFRAERGERPTVARDEPHIRINARLHKGRASLSLDLSGDTLHRRGYRIGQGGAPLKETLAAALLLRAGWPAIADNGGALVDPMCGSGTLLIEGALMALGIAPGLTRRESWGFEHWLAHDRLQWAEHLKQARDHKEQALNGAQLDVFGYDDDPRIIGAAQNNVLEAGLDSIIRLAVKPAEALRQPTHKKLHPGLLITNPPYGERLGEVEALRETYRQLGERAKSEFPGWRFALFTSNPDLARETRLRPERVNKFRNGPIKAELLHYQLLSEDSAQLRAGQDTGRDKSVVEEPHREERDQRPLMEQPLSPGAQMVANRIAKNLRKLKKFIGSADTDCYRVYDADMPEYSAAIDCYAQCLHIQEYEPPKTIDPAKAQVRFNELVHGAAAALQVSDDKLFTKTRRRNKGSQQYEKLGQAGFDPERGFAVREHGASLWVNLEDYLDTGVFLDHRPLRRRIAAQAAGKRFLNLFCYTATATVHAALGGATDSVSVDMSNTYLSWAERNFKLNNIHQSRHKLVRDNCLEWLEKCREGFDMIMLDPPTFSNSKKMDGVMDVQRDHVRMVERCMDILLPGGCLYFSTNFRRFKLDESLNQRFDIRDITGETLDPDFAHNQKIHFCWEIRQRK